MDHTGNLCWVLSIPKDGDCLFGALVHQLYHVTPRNKLFKPYSTQLRETAVREIRNRIEFYYDHVTTFANELVCGDMPEATKVEEYLKLLGTAGFWGGSDCISALANHFAVRIYVHQNNACIKFDPSDNLGQDIPICRIYYRGSTGIRNHYDSIVCVRPHDYSLTPLANVPVEFLQLNHDFKIECQTILQDTHSLVAAIGHQLTGNRLSNESSSILRSLVADEVEAEAQPPSVLSTFGLSDSEQEIADFIYQLRIGRRDGGYGFLILFSSLMDLTIYLHRPTQETLRLSPSNSLGTINIHLLEKSGNPGIQYASVVKLTNTPTRIRRRLDEEEDPLLIADKVSRLETCATPEDRTTLHLDSRTGLRFASLNVNGCRTIEKRNAIDSYLISQKVHVATLQEVNLQSMAAMTNNYRWYLGQKAGSRKRGLALLINLSADITVQFSKAYGYYIQHNEVVYQVSIIEHRI